MQGKAASAASGRADAAQPTAAFALDYQASYLNALTASERRIRVLRPLAVKAF
jgi:hypothetical protein